MSDTKTDDDKTLSVNTKKTLTLKRPGVEQSTVRQNFAWPHEVRRRRNQAQVRQARREVGGRIGVRAEAGARCRVAKAAPQPEAPKVAAARRWNGPTSCSAICRSARSRPARRALEGSKVREVEDRQRAIDDAGRRQGDEERRSASARTSAPPSGRGGSSPARRKRNPRRRAEEEARRRTPLGSIRLEEEEAKPRRTAGGLPPRSSRDAPNLQRPTRTKGEEDRRRGKLTLNSATSEEEARAVARCRRCAAVRRSSSARCTTSRARRSCAKWCFPRRSPSPTSPTACRSARSTS